MFLDCARFIIRLVQCLKMKLLSKILIPDLLEYISAFFLSHLGSANVDGGWAWRGEEEGVFRGQGYHCNKLYVRVV
jgi:hypothetical protein